jgi:hypothetical protein
MSQRPKALGSFFPTGRVEPPEFPSNQAPASRLAVPGPVDSGPPFPPASGEHDRAVADAIALLHHGKHLLTKQDGCLVTVDSRNRVEIAGRIKYTIGELLL